MRFASLSVCTSCECHVDAHETICPHCGQDIVSMRRVRPRSRAAILLGLAAFGATDLSACAVYGVACTDECDTSVPECPPGQPYEPDAACVRPCSHTADCLQTSQAAEICGRVSDTDACVAAKACVNDTGCSAGFVCVKYTCPNCPGGCASSFCFPEGEAPASCDLELDGGL